MALLAIGAGAAAENTAKKILVGDTKVEILAKYQGEALAKPDKVVIYDFNVPASVISVDNSLAARVHRRRPGEPAAANPLEDVAKQVQDSFTKALLHELQQASIQAEKSAEPEGAGPPANAMLVHGEFTTIDEGSKTKRVLIGFGKGASDVQAHVTIALAAATAAPQPMPQSMPQPMMLLDFKMTSKSGKKPGSVATVGAGAATAGTASVGSAAVGVTAGGVLDSAASVESDAARLAKGVAKQIVELMRTQPWAAASPPPVPPGPG